MKDKTKPKMRLSKKKFRMIVEIILSTLHETIKYCETYEEFKTYINSMWKDEK